MRAPGEAIGSVALECAMDELAHELGIDPLELRLRNEPALDPAKEIPFASRDLERCLREGAASFGWSGRHARPGSHRDARFLVGAGMATAIRPNILQQANARVRLGGNGQATAQLDMTDIGTGSYTVLTQIVAEELEIRSSASLSSSATATFRRPPARAAPSARRAPARRSRMRAGTSARPLSRPPATTRPRRFTAWQPIIFPLMENDLVQAALPTRSPTSCAGAASPSRRKAASRLALSTRSTPSIPTARISSRSASMPIRARRASGATAAPSPSRPHPQPQDRPLAAHRRRGLGNRHRAPRGERDGSAQRRLRQPRPC